MALALLFSSAESLADHVRLSSLFEQMNSNLRALTKTNQFELAESMGPFLSELDQTIGVGQGQLELSTDVVDQYQFWAKRFEKETLPLIARLGEYHSLSGWPPTGRNAIFQRALHHSLQHDMGRGINSGRISYHFGGGKMPEFLDKVTENNFPLAIALTTLHLGEVVRDDPPLLWITSAMVKVLSDTGSWSRDKIFALLEKVDSRSRADCQVLLDQDSLLLLHLED